MDQDKDAQKSSPEGDDELENLSSDEKAAFEKIMAEIAAATGGAPKGKGDDPPKKTKNESPLKPSSPSVIPVAEEDPPAEEAQANLDKIMAEISSKKGEKGSTSKTMDTATSPEAASDELSQDQQAALDQIMAEIGSKRKAESIPVSKGQTAVNPEEELNQEQQAALDSIMAEIGSKRKTDKIPDTEKDASDQTDETLNADQQAALDSIMAEIGSKRKPEEKTPSNDADAQPESDPKQETDQQADIEQIMAAIEAKKGKGFDAPSDGSKISSMNDSNPAQTSGGDNLTMEEFDDELSNLLSSAQTTSVSKPAVKAKAVEPPRSQEPSAATTADSDKTAPPIGAGSSDKNGSQPSKEYPILKEVPVEPQPKAGKGSTTRPVHKTKASGVSKKVLVFVGIAMALLVTGIGGYWGYLHTGSTRSNQTVAPESKTVTESAKPTGVDPSQDQAVVTSDAVVVPSTGTSGAQTAALPDIAVKIQQMESPAMMLSVAKGNLTSARQQIQNKITDIEQLKSYYSRGIEEEAHKIEDAIHSGQIPSFDAALADKKIEFSLRAIQRRKNYIAKLDTPLSQLTAMSEQLLFMERRAQIYEILQAGITGLPIESFKNESEEMIGRYLAFNTQISIDQVDLPLPALDTIWGQIESELKQKASSLAQRAPLNRAISGEICTGNFDRKSLLSAISTDTALCLIKWEGKDLYLNGLTELTPEVAAILSQWPGEWISLNGLRQLPAESAKHLSQWPGKRISLNGLSELSPEATAYMSKWKGSQLEMVGLQTIGSWENYGTRLYLSEKLRKQLEGQ